MFDRITCLNLDKRFNEQERIAVEFKKHGLTPEFFLAGNGKEVCATYDHIDILPPANRHGYPAWVQRPNSYNAFLCYKKILKKAWDDGIQIQWLCEDDVTLRDNFGEVLEAAKKELISLPDWDMLYLCANHTWARTTELSPHILKLKGSGGFQFVGIKRKLFQFFELVQMTAPIDEIAGKQFHPLYNCYAVWPNIAVPLGGYSFCEGYSYDNIKLYDNKGCK